MSLVSIILNSKKYSNFFSESENNESFILIENKEKDNKIAKRGRKNKKQNKYKIKHNKYSGDNIIRKIKAQL